MEEINYQLQLPVFIALSIIVLALMFKYPSLSYYFTIVTFGIIFYLPFGTGFIGRNLATPSKLLGGLSIIFAFVHSQSSQRRFIEPNIVFLMYSLVVVTYGLSFFVNSSSESGWLNYLVSTSIFFITTQYWIRDFNHLVYLKYAFIVAVAAGILQSAIAGAGMAHYLTPGSRFSGPWLNANPAAIFCFVGSMFVFQFLVDVQRKLLARFFLLMVLILFVWFTFATGSRSGSLVMMAGSIAGVGIYSHYFKKIGSPILISAAVMLAVVLFTPASFYDRLIQRHFVQGDMDMSEATWGDRARLYGHALKLGMENPALGVGPGNFNVLMIRHQNRYQAAHNGFLEVFVSGGVPALIFYSLMILAALFLIGRVALSKMDVRIRFHAAVDVVLLALVTVAALANNGAFFRVFTLLVAISIFYQGAYVRFRAQTAVDDGATTPEGTPHSAARQWQPYSRILPRKSPVDSGDLPHRQPQTPPESQLPSGP
jgi:hypothetical protein